MRKCECWAGVLNRYEKKGTVYNRTVTAGLKKGSVFMCGIIGYTGHQDAKEVLTEGLRQLEYRGYDSAGIAFLTDNGIKTIKSVGKVECLCEKVEKESDDVTSCGIGHTRWATHGGVTDTNCHPHSAGKVTLIHNGIIRE